tara:strand:- start:374 stop:499 length:126 start_codon:yes stop_codon:yes gene_type:complete
MIKKIIFILLISILISSCGKKGCPKYSNLENKKCDPLFKDK